MSASEPFIFYNIEYPTVDNDRDHRSIDAQVNGFGFYRKITGGTEGLLVARLPIPGVPRFSASSPTDAYGIGSAELIFQPFITASGIHTGFLFTDANFAFTNGGDRAAIIAGGTLENNALTYGLTNRVTHDLSISGGSFAMFIWELDTTVDKDDGMAAYSTHQWEGVNGYFLTAANVLTNTARMSGVGFRRFEVFGAIAGRSKPFYLNDSEYQDVVSGGNAPYEKRHIAFVTQRWEKQDNENSLMSSIPDPNELSEDASGRRATHRWEINQQGIEQTSYWIYIDLSEDADLGAAVETDNDVPEPMNQLSVFQEHMFGSGDPENPHYLRWSKRFRPEAWPQENFAEIGTANDPIKTHVPITGVLGVFTTQTKYRISGNATSGFVHDEAVSHRGAPSSRSAIATDRGVVFVARDGVFATNFIGPDTKLSDAIDPIFYGETKNGYSPINWDQAALICSGFYKNKFYFSYPSGTSTSNDMTAVYSFDTQQWTFWTVGFASFYAERDTDLFLGGGNDATVYVIDDPATFDDDGTAITMELETRNYVGKNHTTRNLFLYFKVDAECQDGEIDVSFYVDDALVQTHTITGSRTCKLLSLPTNTFGKRWRVKTSYTGNRRVSIFNVSSIFIPLEAA